MRRPMMMRGVARAWTVVALAACARAAHPAHEGAGMAAPRAPAASAPVLVTQRSGTTALLQAVSVVDARTVWVSGHQGTWARTLDGGATWETGRVPGADTLQFRDVQAMSADTALLLGAGNGDLSRIYRTTDGGRHWSLRWVNDEPRAFFDCFAFWDARRGLAFSDAVDGAQMVLATTDGGVRWERIPPASLPAALPDEGSFAASGTCVATAGEGDAWIGLGNTSAARVLRTRDGGRSWSASVVPVASGTAAGIASVIFRDTLHGVALGGEIGKPVGRGDYVARTADGGRTWSVGGRPTFAGAVYGAAYVPGAPTPTIVAVGPGGMDLSTDDGGHWARLDTLAYWSVGFASPAAGWAVGPGGRIVKVVLAGASASASR
ncbi:MAG TPA: hypothetical protein VFS44_12285 [Gemmatimonadaceae bacterium]|nr:hypothetical protein [Gemmatimonadaceae bacterium]